MLCFCMYTSTSHLIVSTSSYKSFFRELHQDLHKGFPYSSRISYPDHRGTTRTIRHAKRKFRDVYARDLNMSAALQREQSDVHKMWNRLLRANEVSKLLSQPRTLTSEVLHMPCCHANWSRRAARFAGSKHNAGLPHIALATQEDPQRHLTRSCQQFASCTKCACDTIRTYTSPQTYSAKLLSTKERARQRDTGGHRGRKCYAARAINPPNIFVFARTESVTTLLREKHSSLDRICLNLLKNPDLREHQYVHWRKPSKTCIPALAPREVGKQRANTARKTSGKENSSQGHMQRRPGLKVPVRSVSRKGSFWSKPASQSARGHLQNSLKFENWMESSSVRKPTWPEKKCIFL